MLPFIKCEITESSEPEPYQINYDFLKPIDTSDEVKREQRKIQRRRDRASESEEQTKTRREADKERHRSRRATETEDQRESRREKAKLRARHMRAMESDEQRSRRRQLAKERKRLERAMESEEQSAKRREIARQRIRLVRAMETEEEKEKRRLQARERVKMKRALELEDEKRRRREIAKLRARRIRANESEEQRRKRNERGRERMKRKRLLNLLKAHGYTDDQLAVYNEYLENYRSNLSNGTSEYVRIKQFLLGDKKSLLPELSPKLFLPEAENDDTIARIDPEPLDNRLEPQNRRIADIRFLFEQLQKFSLHNLRCNFSAVTTITETIDGVCSEIKLKCKNCNATFDASLNDPQSNLNDEVVKAAENSGLGFAGISSLFGSVGLLSIAQDKYMEIQNKIGYNTTLNVIKREQFSDSEEET